MVKRMSGINLQISSIKNLDMVNFYHLFDEGTMVPGILAYYEGSKVINLCAADEGFPELLDKIVEVYSQEQQYNRIVADNDTQEILNRSISTPLKDYEEMLCGYTEIDRPIFLDKAFMHIAVLPIVKYIVEGIYGVNDMTVNWNLYNKSWFGRGILTGTVKEKRLQFPYFITRQNDKMYRVILNGVLRQDNVLTVYIVRDIRGLTISFSDSLYGHAGTFITDITDTTPMVSFNIERDGQKMFNSEDVLPKSDKVSDIEALKLSWKDASFSEYSLPWGEKIHVATNGNKTLCIFSSETVTERLSYGICSERLDDNGKLSVRLGLFAYMLFDSVTGKELHFLDMGYPQLALYKENYAGKCYTHKEGRHNGN